MNGGEVVWKFPVPLDGTDSNGRLSVSMPNVARVLDLQVQYDVPTLWAQVVPKSPTVVKAFAWVGTGGSVPDGGEYVGTVQVRGGTFVFHLYEVGAS